MTISGDIRAARGDRPGLAGPPHRGGANTRGRSVDAPRAARVPALLTGRARRADTARRAGAAPVRPQLEPLAIRNTYRGRATACCAADSMGFLLVIAMTRQEGSPMS